MILHSSQRLWRIALAVALGLLAIIAYWPTPLDQPVHGALTAAFSCLHRNGFPVWINYKVLEASANVALFLPIGFVSTLAFPNKAWWLIGGFGFAISACMEVGQLLFLHNRFASLLDVVTNTSGAVIGAALAAVVLKKTEARHLAATGP